MKQLFIIKQLFHNLIFYLNLMEVVGTQTTKILPKIAYQCSYVNVLNSHLKYDFIQKH